VWEFFSFVAVVVVFALNAYIFAYAVKASMFGSIRRVGTRVGGGYTGCDVYCLLPISLRTFRGFHFRST
jgi:hypothetical protein